MTAQNTNQLGRVNGIGVLELRGNAGDPDFVACVTSAVGTLPTQVGRTGDGEDHTLLCLSPDRWWISGAEAKIACQETRLRDALEGMVHAILPLSSGLASFRLKGPNAAEILAKGTAIDLDAGAFPNGSVCRTLHAGISIVIHHPRRKAAELLFDLHVQRSYQHYLENWLLLAGQDYAMTAGKEWSH